MLNKKYLGMFSLIAVALSASACSEDGVAVHPSDEGCSDVCEESHKKCDDNAVWLCSKQDDGCTDWQKTDSCPSGTHCDDSTWSCEAGCAEVCNADADARCGGEGIQKCHEDENGCAVWENAEKCDYGCDTDLIACKSCTDECTDSETKCVGGQQATCIEKDGCHVWGTPVDSDACAQDTCTDECTDGEAKCEGDKIVKCTKKDKCFAWAEPVSCGTKQICDSAKKACVAAPAGCVSECTENDTKALAASSLICKDANNDGCFEWVEDKKCKQGEKYDATKKACVSVCGSECKPFSIIFMPDTQSYVANFSKSTSAMVADKPDGRLLAEDLKWIHDNYEKENIVAVMHHGDMTNDNMEYAWVLNDKYYKQYMDPIDLPYLPAAGNHDYYRMIPNANGIKADSTHRRNEIHISDYGKFNDARFATKKWFGDGKGKGFYKTSNSYMTVTASGVKFLFLSLEFLPRKDVICWAEELIASHPDHKVIISTHAYLAQDSIGIGVRGKDGRFPITNDGKSGFMKAPFHIWGMPTGAVGPEIYTELAARHNNVILVTSGHFRASGFRLNKGNADNWFGEMIVDYQDEHHTDGKCSGSSSAGGSGAGWMRMLTFDPVNYTITAKDITPIADAKFSGGKKKFYCQSEYNYPADPNLQPKSHLSAKDPTNAATNYHSFIVDYDFVTPVDYKVTEADTPFIRRIVNEMNYGYQTKPAVAANRKTRDFVVAWADDAYDNTKKDTDGANNHDIHARVFCKTGCNLVSDFVVNTTKKGDQKDAKVAMNDRGDFVVVWTNAADSSVYMRKFDITGNEIVKETKVNTSGKAGLASVGIASDGSYIVSWQTDNDVLMRGFDAKGVEKIKQQKVSATALNTKGVRSLSKVASASDGSFVITWEDDADGNGDFNISARGFKQDGSEKLKEFVVNTVTKGQQRSPAIDMNEDGIFYIAWADYADNDKVARVRARGFNNKGAQTMADKYVQSTTTHNAESPDVCVTGSGKAHFSWFVANGVDENDVMASSLADLKDVVISTDPDAQQREASIACTNGERFISVWSDNFNTNQVEELGTESSGDWEIMCREM